MTFGTPVEITASSADSSWYIRLSAVNATTGSGLGGQVGNTDYEQGSNAVAFEVPLEYFLPTGPSTLSLAVTVDYDVENPILRRLGSQGRELESNVEEHIVELKLAQLILKPVDATSSLDGSDGSGDPELEQEHGGYRSASSIVGIASATAAAVMTAIAVM